MAKYTDAAWSTPESSLEPGEFCRVCLIDMNEGEKIKAKCKLPIRSKPGGPINKNALRNAASRIFQMKGVSPEKKKAAARKLVSMMRGAGMEPGPSVLKLAGAKGK